MPPVRNTLMTKAVQSAPLNGPTSPNPATLTRPGHVEMDPGRPWAGDLYDHGAVSDPVESFASFGDGGDIEAWLDKGDDGVLIGWVREGEAVYRYSDPESWSIDVDGAGMQRTDGGSASMEGEAIPEGAGDELAVEGEEMLGDEASTADASVGDLDPTAFEEEDDEAVEEGDPTDALADPTNPVVEEVTGDGGPDAQGAFADMLTDDTLPDAAAAAPAAAAEEADDEDLEFEEGETDPDATDPLAEPEDEDAEAEEMLTIAPADLPTTDDPDEPEDPEDPDADEDEDDDEEDEGKKRPPFERKHLPGQHHQESHGNRVSIGVNKPRATRTPSLPSGAGANAPASGDRKVTISALSVKSMSDKDLAAIMDGDDFYDYATMEAAAKELDRRDPLDDKFKQAFAKTEPGSLAEHQLLRDVIPPQWIAWAATNATKRPTRSAAATREDEWLSFAQAQYLAALEAVNGQFYRARFRAKPPFGEFGFFDGSVTGAQAKKYMSRELAEWWDTHGVTKSEFMREFSDRAGRGYAGKRTEMYT